MANSRNIFHRLLLLALVAFVAVEATQVMRRPDNYKEAPNKVVTAQNAKVNAIQRRANGKVSFAYFTNWGIYGANFQPTDINSKILTHILYSFADTDASSGQIKLTDPYADEQKHFPGDSWSEPGNNVYGCIKQLYLLKLKQRNLKVLLSIGGWTYSQAGHFNFVTNPSARATFVNSAIQIIQDYGFDGIDIDYEYPANSAQGQGLADLMTEMRRALTSLQQRNGETVPYLLTAAVPAGPVHYVNLKIKQMDDAMDHWNLMAYDYSGSWLTFSDNQANVYGGARTGFNTEQAVNYYLANGAKASKMVLGMPLYGRAFQNTNGLGQPYSGIGQGTIEPGIYSYKVLPLAGAQIFENSTDISSYSYDAGKRELVSYDTPNIIRQKARYLNNKGFGGSMFWELSTDKTNTADSLIQVAVSAMGGSLDSTQNHIKFPNSKWDNIKNNMAGSPTASPTSTPSPTNPGGGGCSGVAPWSATAVYVGGQTASYAGRLWTAAWWTQGDVPGGQANVWRDSGAC